MSCSLGINVVKQGKVVCILSRRKFEWRTLCTEYSHLSWPCDVGVLSREQSGRRLFQVLAAISPTLSAGTESEEVQSWCGAIEASFAYIIFCTVASQRYCAVCTDNLGGHFNSKSWFCSSACRHNSACVASQSRNASLYCTWHSCMLLL